MDYALEQIILSDRFCERLKQKYPDADGLKAAKEQARGMIRDALNHPPACDNPKVRDGLDLQAKVTLKQEVTHAGVTRTWRCGLTALEAMCLRHYHGRYDYRPLIAMAQAKGALPMTASPRIAPLLQAIGHHSLYALPAMLETGLFDPNFRMLQGNAYMLIKNKWGFNIHLHPDDFSLSPLENTAQWMLKKKPDMNPNLQATYTRALMALLDHGAIVSGTAHVILAKLEQQGLTEGIIDYIERKRVRTDAVISGEVPAAQMTRQDMLDAFALEKLPTLLKQAEKDPALQVRLNSLLPSLPLWLQPEIETGLAMGRRAQQAPLWLTRTQSATMRSSFTGQFAR